MTSENRDRFLRLNPARTEKAVSAILTLAQTGNRKNYDYTVEEAQALPKPALNPIPVRGHPRSQLASSQFRIERPIPQIEIPMHQYLA